VAFLHHMMITFLVLAVCMTAVTLARPLAVPATLPEAEAIDMTGSRSAKVGGALVILATVALYIRFW